MSRKEKKRMSQKKKALIFGGITAGFIAIGGLVWWQQSAIPQTEDNISYKSVNVTEGTIASSTLLTGSVKAFQEQYVYYDANKGTNATVAVAVGDQVTVGQKLVQYDTTTAQSAYDTAVRNQNKVGRQLNYLKTYGNLPTTTASTDEETGATTATTAQPTQQQNSDYNQQLQDLNDAYADAQAEVNKAQEAINDTVIVSDVAGTVAEVNKDIDPSSKNSQTLVHIATEGQLQIQGTLTEYDLANIHTGQAVKIKSKVYPDQEWAGKISYISNYPSQTNDATNSTNATTSSTASYNYKVDLTSDIGSLKQGFTVSVEVANENKYKLVPVSAIVSSKSKNYVWVYDDSTGKVSKVEVTLGNADATNQEVMTGLEVGKVVISNPNSKLKDGAKLKDVSLEDTSATKKSEGSKK